MILSLISLGRCTYVSEYDWIEEVLQQHTSRCVSKQVGLLPSSFPLESGESKSPSPDRDSLLDGWWKSRGMFSLMYLQYTPRAATLNTNISAMIAK